MCYQIATERLCGHVEVTHPSHCGGTLATCETILVEFRRPAKEERLCFKCDPPLAAWRANEVHWYGYLRPGRKIGQDLIQELHEDETIAKVEKIFSAQRKEARSSLVKYLERSNPSSKISLTPCGGLSFACGLNTTSCQTGEGIVTFERPSALVLRPSQVSALLAAQGINTTTPSPSATQTSSDEPLYVDGQRMYPSSTVLALGLGMGFPLAFLVIAVVVMYRKLRARAPRDMYDPPDQPPVPMVARSIASRPSTSSLGRSPTIHTMHSSHTLHEPAAMPRSFLDRYAQKSKEDHEVHEIDMGNPRYELAPNHVGRSPSRAELNGSQPTDSWQKINKEPIGY
ncbi:Hypothetical protein D9617_23g004800 [Elsinoe fawcettii]|nr:Hypothetical protein D9617_23g004800 [Elsinoe fawcettii]